MEHGGNERAAREDAADARGGARNGSGSAPGGMAMDGADLKRRFVVSLVLAVPVLLLSSPMGIALPVPLSFPGSAGSSLRSRRRFTSTAACRFCAGRRASCAGGAPP